MTEFIEKYINSLNHDITDKIWRILNEKEYPFDSKCVAYIRDHWIEEHKECIEEAWADKNTFEIDEEDLDIYWFEYVGTLMDDEKGNEHE